eukprot:373680-Hanusia_phi.AAC.1
MSTLPVAVISLLDRTLCVLVKQKLKLIAPSSLPHLLSSPPGQVPSHGDLLSQARHRPASPPAR